MEHILNMQCFVKMKNLAVRHPRIWSINGISKLFFYILGKDPRKLEKDKPDLDGFTNGELEHRYDT